MATKKGGDPRLSWPPDFDEIFKRMHKQEMWSWREPKSGDLLRDVGYLQGRIAKEKIANVPQHCNIEMQLQITSLHITGIMRVPAFTGARKSLQGTRRRLLRRVL